MEEGANKGSNYGGKRVRKAMVGRRLPSREYPPCPDCGTRNVMRNGTRKGRQMLRCRDCGRSFFGEIPALEFFPCPYCGKNCRRHGYAPNGRQLYLCTVCGRLNTNLWPEAAQDTGGPYRYSLSFYLDTEALAGLSYACRLWSRNHGQAIRRLLIVASAGAFLDTMEDTLAITAAEGLPPEMAFIRRVSPDLGDMPECRVVTVSLNDRALQGLAWTMRVNGLTRQEAVRWLLRRVLRGDFDGTTDVSVVR